MFAVLPVLAWSVWLVRSRHKYLLHKRVQLALGLVLLLAVAAFEIDMQINGWEHRATATPGAPVPPHVYWALYVHLVFAVTTALLWPWVIVQALRKFPNPPLPGAHSRQHVPLAWAATVDMCLTAVTGWIFYYLAFVQ
jgi:hypothetical protein